MIEMKGNPYLTYVDHYASYMRGDSEELMEAKKRNGQRMMTVPIPETMTVEDRTIEGHPQGKPEVAIRIFKPQAEGPLPMILDIHGGGWVAGNLDIDNGRCAAIAARVPAIVISVDYTLSNGTDRKFPMPLMDCYQAYMWMHDHAEEIGGDASKLGIHGSSAGANISAGLALYLRDVKAPACSLAVLNCPCIGLDLTEQASFMQNYELRMGPDGFGGAAEYAYLGGAAGQPFPYYAFPDLCPDVRGLCPHFIMAAEYDTLRDDAMKYAMRLMRAGVQVDVQVAARACHCFTAIPHPYTDLSHDLMAFNYRREFGML